LNFATGVNGRNNADFERFVPKLGPSEDREGVGKRAPDTVRVTPEYAWSRPIFPNKWLA
jgi:hypothetical protein